MNTSEVKGSAKAQYTQWFPLITSPPSSLSQSSEGIAKTAARNVAGRNAMVMIAIVFMAELSRWAASAILRLESASSKLIVAS